MNEPVSEGEVLAGKYRVEKVLGQGGMGIVVAAMHMQLNQRVAIKLLLDNATQDVVARFLREARAAVRLKSEHVARVIDVGELPNGAPYMVMEHLAGNDLSQVVRKRGPLAVHDAVAFVLHACEAIGEAHGFGIIHRDLKPANLFLTKAADGTDTVKVLDFGISKAATGDPESEPAMSLTKTTAVLGSPLYMAPEQMKSARDADARSDIWSLGAILYELLAGQVPFNAMTFPELIMMANMDPPPPLSNFRSDVPPALEAALLKALEKKPANRYANVAELAWAIAEWGPHEAQASAERTTRTMEAAGLTLNGATTGSGLRKSRVSDTRSPSLMPPPVEAGTMAALAASSDGTIKTGRAKWVAVGAGVGLAVALAATVMILRSKPSTSDIAAVPAVTAAGHDARATPTGAATIAPTGPVVVASAPIAIDPPHTTAATPAGKPGPAAIPKPGVPQKSAAPAQPPPAQPPPAQPPPAQPPPAQPPPTKKNPLDIQIQ